jgi:hypothetical protein
VRDQLEVSAFGISVQHYWRGQQRKCVLSNTVFIQGPCHFSAVYGVANLLTGRCGGLHRWPVLSLLSRKRNRACVVRLSLKQNTGILTNSS